MTNKELSLSKKIYISISLIVSLYFVIGGIAGIIINEKFEHAQILPESKTYDGKDGEYRNIKEQEASEEYEKYTSYYPTHFLLGSTLSNLFILMSFGILGAIIRILLNNISTHSSIRDAEIYINPVLGALAGLLTIIVSQILPEFKNQTGSDKVYYTLALIGGVFTRELFNWLKLKLERSLK